jgi:iron complex outermembrane receptor protein
MSVMHRASNTPKKSHRLSLSQRVLFSLCVLVATGSLWADQDLPNSSKPRLINLGLEDLMKIEVTSVSKRPERLLDAAASIYVITAEEIRRSGVTSLPEALRLAPNLQVAQVSGPGYAITARGFNATSANKLLVLIDGRSVYTPLFSGVFWDAQDVMLEDVERIEVISGPGGTLWGVNAVNGIINVITRSAKDTRGGLLAAGAGNRESDTELRYGGSLGSDGDYRVFGKYFDRKHTSTVSGSAKDDAWHQGHVGFRADWRRAANAFTLEGNAYKGAEGQPLPGSISISGTKLALGVIPIKGLNLIGQWRRVIGGRSLINFQAYYDRTERTVPPAFAENLQIVDLQLQYSVRPLRAHSLTWGGEYRHGRDRVVNSSYIAFLPANVNQTWSSLFAEDDIALRKNLRFNLGARVERNDYTGNEFLPNARLAWKIAADHFMWAAASRAVRAPSRLDRDTFVPGSPPFLLRGGPGVISETAKVYEIGYRGEHSTLVTYSVTAFQARYDHLRTQEIAPSRTFLLFASGMEGTSSGLELWSTYQPARIWRLSGGFTRLKEKFNLKPGSNDANAVSGQLGRDPARGWRLRSSLDLPYNTEFDIIGRRVSELTSPVVPAYTAVDVRCGWRPRRDLEVSLTAQNLFDHGHGEFTAASTRTEFGRSVFIKISNRFGRHD